MLNAAARWIASRVRSSGRRDQGADLKQRPVHANQLDSSQKGVGVDYCLAADAGGRSKQVGHEERG